MRKLIKLFVIVFSLLIGKTTLYAATSTLDVLLQPQLKVVDYNQQLESLKSNLLNNVSIFSDQALFTQWSNMITSIGILFFIAILIKVGLSIVYGSKDNMFKFIAFIVLLFFIGGIYAPLFSGVSEFMTGEERVYTDPETKIKYSRVYLPANTAITVLPYYIDKNSNVVVNIEGNSNLFPRRNDSSKYSWEYLGIPAKVAQTQWQSDTDPTIRYSKAFYGVNVDTLFKGTSLNFNLGIKNGELLGITKNGKCEVTLQPNDFGTVVDKSPMTFLDAIGGINYQLEAEMIMKASDGHVKDPKPITLSKFKNSPTITDISQQITITKDCNNFSLGLYLMSDEYLKSLGDSEVNISDSLTSSRSEIRSFSMNFYGALNSGLKILLNSLSYQEQKKLWYTFQAYSTLYNLTQKPESSEIKEGSDRLKESIYSCGRIVNGTVQDTSDYKKCLIVDQAGDTTIYTQETSRELGLLGKDQSTGKGYVLPVPIGIDWTKESLSNSYGDAKSILDNGVLAVPITITTNAIKESNDSILSWTKGGIDKIVLGIKNLFGYGEIETTIENAGISFNNINDKEVELKVYQWILQKNMIKDFKYWYSGVFNPFLSSFNSYDLNGDGLVDYKQQSEEKTDITYYGFHYGSKPPSLTKDQVNFTQQSFNTTEDYGTIGEYCEFISDEDRASIFTKCNDGKYQGDVKYTGYKIGNEYFYTPSRSTPYYLTTGVTTVSTEIDSKVKSRSTIQLSGRDLYLGTGDTYYDVTPLGENKSQFSVTVKDSIPKEYKYFPIRSDLSQITGYNKNGKKITIGSLYKFVNIGFTLGAGASKEIFILDNGVYTIYKGSIKGQKKTQSEFESEKGKTVSEYRLSYDQIANPVYRIEAKDASVTGYNYVEEVSTTALDWKSSSSKDISKLALMTNDTVGDYQTIYSLRNLETLEIISFNLQLERTINRIYSTNPFTRLADIKGQLGINLGNSKEIIRTKYKSDNEVLVGKKKQTTLKMVNYKKNDDVFYKNSEKNSIAPRILLNYKLNIPLTFTPSNESYLSEYKKANKVCLISKDATDTNKTLFDYYPGLSTTSLDKCSTIGDHMRLTDSRLQTFIQEGSLLTIGANKSIFTHFSVPLLTSKYIPSFSLDRRDQNYMGETKQSDSLFSPKQVSGVTVREGDVFVLKPGVIVGSYSHPFTMLVPTDLLSFIKYVKLDNPSEEIMGSYVYTGGIYDWLTGITKFIMDGETSQKVFGRSIVSETDEQKYGRFLQQKYDSRPDALKFIEGSVPDRYFHAYYGEGYVNDSKSGMLSGIGSLFSEMILSFSTWLLEYRVIILKWIYIFSPLIAFTLLFTGTRKIFSFSVALTIGLLTLPVIVLFFVNIFS